MPKGYWDQSETKDHFGRAITLANYGYSTQKKIQKIINKRKAIRKVIFTHGLEAKVLTFLNYLYSLL